MAYRDDLEAAKRRIERLEAELDGRRDDSSDATSLPADPTQPGYAVLRRLAEESKRRKSLEGQVAELTNELARLRLQSGAAELERQVDELRSKLGGAERRVAELEREAARPLSLWEHNRTDPALRAAPPAPVLCPVCLGHGERVPMTDCPPSSIAPAWAHEPHVPMVCPRCLFVGLQRGR